MEMTDITWCWTDWEKSRKSTSYISMDYVHLIDK